MRTLLGMEVKLDVPFEVALARTREALKTEGFGVLTEIDLQAAFKEKLGRAFRPYVILGACNPPLAHTALSADPEVGLLLPCNVTVEADPEGGSVVRLVDPERLLTTAALDGSPLVGSVAKDAGERLRRVAGALSARTPA
ncbi:MAG TPA: DUF302 domain-containing protein [Gemmatimonadales bacterium]|nr:DUF302 domain-containing protein [Gemmatimonadales bacterium]